MHSVTESGFWETPQTASIAGEALSRGDIHRHGPERSSGPEQQTDIDTDDSGLTTRWRLHDMLDDQSVKISIYFRIGDK